VPYPLQIHAFPISMSFERRPVSRPTPAAAAALAVVATAEPGPNSSREKWPYPFPSLSSSLSRSSRSSLVRFSTNECRSRRGLPRANPYFPLAGIYFVLFALAVKVLLSKRKAIPSAGTLLALAGVFGVLISWVPNLLHIT
jgi:hypothetical protein